MSTPNPDTPRIAVIGAGAAGLMAAGTALQAGAAVTVFEHRPKAGRKLLITGKGRCNVTNDCPPDEFLASVLTNPRFLFGALHALPPAALMELIEAHGTPLKTERGKRVFPVSDKAGNVLSALLCYAAGADFVHAHADRLIVESGRVVGLVAADKEYLFDAVILATGGLSYPLTGSDGSGYGIARRAGHTVVPLTPSLVPLTSPDQACAAMQGLSLKNVGLNVRDPAGKTVYTDFGEMLFTHFGVSGPMVLSASAHLKDADLTGYRLFIDLKPALDPGELDRRLLSDFSKFSNRDFCNALEELLPRKMIPEVVKKCGIDPAKKVHEITKSERQALLGILKGFPVALSGRRPIEEAIVTRGGVCVREIDPRTMRSKVVDGLYLAGEIIDVDAYTGGFNLQIAFSTGYLAGRSAAEAKGDTAPR